MPSQADFPTTTQPTVNPIAAASSGSSGQPPLGTVGQPGGGPPATLMQQQPLSPASGQPPLSGLPTTGGQQPPSSVPQASTTMNHAHTFPQFSSSLGGSPGKGSAGNASALGSAGNTSSFGGKPGKGSAGNMLGPAGSV